MHAVCVCCVYAHTYTACTPLYTQHTHTRRAPLTHIHTHAHTPHATHTPQTACTPPHTTTRLSNTTHGVHTPLHTHTRAHPPYTQTACTPHTHTAFKHHTRRSPPTHIHTHTYTRTHHTHAHAPHTHTHTHTHHTRAHAPYIRTHHKNGVHTPHTHTRMGCYTPISEPNFMWGCEDSQNFKGDLNRIYDEAVHWRRNLFKVPSGKPGKSFVCELTRLFRAYAEGSALEGVALKAAMTMPALLLQKPSSKSKAKEHASHLERRLKLWSEGQLVNLLYEGRSIQKQLHRNQPPQQNQDQEDRMAKKFAKLMSEGKVRAKRLITNTGSTGLLNQENPASPNDPNSTKTVPDVLVAPQDHLYHGTRLHCRRPTPDCF